MTRYFTKEHSIQVDTEFNISPHALVDLAVVACLAAGAATLGYFSSADSNSVAQLAIIGGGRVLDSAMLQEAIQGGQL